MTADWSGALIPGEVVLWQGGPPQGSPIASSDAGAALVQLAVTAVIWSLLLHGSLTPSPGVLAFAVGMTVLNMGLRGLNHRRTLYAVTNIRVLIVTGWPIRACVAADLARCRARRRGSRGGSVGDVRLRLSRFGGVRYYLLRQVPEPDRLVTLIDQVRAALPPGYRAPRGRPGPFFSPSMISGGPAPWAPSTPFGAPPTGPPWAGPPTPTMPADSPPIVSPPVVPPPGPTGPLVPEPPTIAPPPWPAPQPWPQPPPDR